MVPFIFHKVWKRDSLTPPATMDIWTGKEEVDIYERENPPPEPKNMYDPHLLFFSLITKRTLS